MPDPHRPKTLHALLVGIDDYDPPVPRLNGCVNDVDAFEAYLRGRAGGTDLRIRVLRDEQATRSAIIAGFREHLQPARAGDVALFYYAGHGSQEQAPPEFWHLEPDRLDETLVCYDSRESGRWDLADKELAKLIDEVAAAGAHVVVILDCCHSGSGTRDLAATRDAVRRVSTDLRARPLDSFLVGPDEADRLSGTRGLADTPSSWPVGRHVLMAACRDNEEASEYRGDGLPRGAFSYFLGQALQSASGPLTYRDLFARADALLRSKIRTQSPLIESTSTADLDAIFLDGAIRPSDPYFTVAAQDDRWILRAGSAHGLPPVEGSATVELALYPFDALPEHLSDPSRAVGRARVVEVRPTSSVVELSGVADLTSAATFKAVIVRLPLPALAVRLEGDEPGVAQVREAIAHAGPDGGKTLYIREAEAGESSEFRLLARGGVYAITGPGNDRPLVGWVEGYSEGNAQKVVRRLEHMARWTLAVRLSNPDTTIQPGEVEMTILQDGRELVGPEIRLEYRLEAGRWIRPEFKVRLTNKGHRRLFVALLDLTETFKIFAGLQEGGSVRLDPGETAWAYRGRPIPATVPDELWRQGVIEYHDILKLLVCTDEFDAVLMEQPALDLPRKLPSRTRSLRDSSLDRLMSRLQTRDLGDDDPVSPDNWTASSVAFTTVRPLETSPVPAAGAGPAWLAGGATLQAHPKLSARARLSTAPTASRDLGNLALPRLLRDDPGLTQPFVVAATRGDSPGLSVLELTEVQHRESVTPEEPLRLEVPVTTVNGEHVLPVGFDGEFFLPLGRAMPGRDGGTVIVIERLPGDHAMPSLHGPTQRSLAGSIKIFLQKVACAGLEHESEAPILAAATVEDSAGQEEVVSDGDISRVRARVSQARTVLLLVPGVIGDTREIRRGMRRAKVKPERKPVDSLFDLVLTFDSHSWNTSIEDAGRELKERLEAVGLGPDHGKELTVLAHSTGGLVARWFTEREGGDRVVSRLVLCGTPNGGLPWPTVHDWALGTLAIGLNGLATRAWPASVVGGLVAALGRADIHLDPMHPGSPLLQELTSRPGPSVPCILLCGDTSLSPASLIVDSEGLSPVRKLLARLRWKPDVHGPVDTLFHDQANDMAVPVASMRALPGPRDPAHDVRSVACDHLNYFHHQTSLDVLATVLSETVHRSGNPSDSRSPFFGKGDLSGGG